MKVPRLERLDGNGNLPFPVDHRQLYATVLEKCWRVRAAPLLRERYEALEISRA